MTGKIKLNAASGGGSVSLQAPSSSGNDRVYTVPDIGSDGTLATTATAGKILQVIQSVKLNTASFAANSGFNDTGLSATMTPSKASSKILVTYRIFVGMSSGNVRVSRLASSVAGASFAAVSNTEIRSYYGNTQDTSQINNISFDFLDSPSYSLGQTVAYRVEYNPLSSTGYINRWGGSGSAGNVVSVITLMEVAA